MAIFQPGKNRFITFLAISLIIYFTLFTSGCIHIDLGNPFHEPEPELSTPHVVNKPGFPLTHEFDMREDQDLKYSETQPFYLPKGTEWINISITIVLNYYELINDTPLNTSLLDRYVIVKLTDPENNLQIDEEFTETDEVLRTIVSPQPGRWIVAVDARGWGNDEIHDYYIIDVISLEPT